AKIYKNNHTIPNTRPSAPMHLTAVVTDYQVHLSWSAGSDTQTSAPGLNYNLKIGTSPGACDIVSPMSLSNGNRQIPSRGMMQSLSTTMTINTPGTYYWRVQTIDAAFAGSPFSEAGSFTIIALGPVRNVYTTSHEINTPSSNPVIQMQWLPPETGSPEGYYVLFNTNNTHVFDVSNTVGFSIIHTTQATSSDFSGVDDVGYYFHVAATALDATNNLIIGPTVSSGPYRVDTTPPLMPLVNIPAVVKTRTITIQLNATHASEMYISQMNYETNGQWEAFSQTRQWELQDIQGDQVIYVSFRDQAGNIARASASIRYDAIAPIPTIATDAPLPARTSPIEIHITFDEPVTDFSETDLFANNCMIQNFTSDQPGLCTHFVLECIPVSQGIIQLSIGENIAQDEAGNPNQASELFEWIYDTSAPQIQAISDQTIQVNGSQTISLSITNSNGYHGQLSIDAWADQPFLVAKQGLIINSQGNPISISLAAGASQTLSLQINPTPQQVGQTLIQILVSDATGMTAQTAFQLEVLGHPEISHISDIQMDESTTYSIPIVLTDLYQQNLFVDMISSNPLLMGPDHMSLISPVCTGTGFPYNCQTTGQKTISADVSLTPAQ
ncbi:MAG: hypothetical protein OMM_12334, partial [Candidatus Magnetoglobus multicellularis str. Araruama]